MRTAKISNPYKIYNKQIVNDTYEFIDTLTDEEVAQRRTYYRRELNKDQFIPPGKIEKMHCFIHLTTT